MPASSFSGLNSWGVYLLASVALVLLFTPQLAGLSRDSRAGSDWRNVDGLRAVIDSLRPGMRVEFSYGFARVSDSLELSGRAVRCSDGNGTVSMPVSWALPNVTLTPGVHYLFTLSRGEVQVSPNE